ncbi:MAG: hypothetical protein MPJ50_14520 [Pirellulales bacterium]|nr:hypothetical protein [Pirellulales bacterium]
MSADTEHPETSAPPGDETFSLARDEISRLVRRMTADGGDELHGVFRVCFEAGDNRASLFVPFSPAFESDPEIEFEQVGGPDCAIKLAGCFPHGLRLELKIAQPCPGHSPESGDVVLELFATDQIACSEEQDDS